MTKNELIKQLTEIVNEGGTSDHEKLTLVTDMITPPSRLEFISDNYTVDPTLRFVFNKHTGKKVHTTIHAGHGRSPIPLERAIWIIVRGTDPYIVGRESESERLYCIPERGMDREYL